MQKACKYKLLNVGHFQLPFSPHPKRTSPIAKAWLAFTVTAAGFLL